jgi:hypothetical protein
MNATIRTLVERETASTAAITIIDKKMSSATGSHAKPAENGWTAINSKRVASKFANLQDDPSLVEGTRVGSIFRGLKRIKGVVSKDPESDFRHQRRAG